MLCMCMYFQLYFFFFFLISAEPLGSKFQTSGKVTPKTFQHSPPIITLPLSPRNFMLIQRHLKYSPDLDSPTVPQMSFISCFFGSRIQSSVTDSIWLSCLWFPLIKTSPLDCFHFSWHWHCRRSEFASPNVCLWLIFKNKRLKTSLTFPLTA